MTKSDASGAPSDGRRNVTTDRLSRRNVPAIDDVEPFEWNAITDAKGAAHFEDLPSEQPSIVYIESGGALHCLARTRVSNCAAVAAPAKWKLSPKRMVHGLVVDRARADDPMTIIEVVPPSSSPFASRTTSAAR